MGFIVISVISLKKLEERFIAFLITVAIVVGFMQVTSRFIFKSSLPWSEELLRFVFIWVTFLGASVAVREKAHVSVSVLLHKLPVPFQKAGIVAGLLFSIGFCGAIVYYGMQIITVQVLTNQLSTAMEIPMWLPYLGVVVGSFMMAIRFLQNLISLLTEQGN
ncbi:MAG: TRAP transporter small permease [Bacillota bacterium]